MNIASIDIGSNTVLLLIAAINNKELTTILNRYESPRLGKGLQIGGNIQNDRIDHLLLILEKYKELIDEYNCTEIIVTATNAMRIASNSEEICEDIKNKFDLNVNIIPGDEEARLSFLGASTSLPNIEDKVVIDIGGGSTEIIWGNQSDIFYKHSYQTGVVSLTEKFLSNFPYTEDSINNAKKYLTDIFEPIKKNIPKNFSTIAVAGTPTTLSCIKQGLKTYDENKVESSILTGEDISILFEKLSKMSGEEIKHKFGQVVEGREDVLFSGLLILQHIMQIKLIDRINVSSKGIRYGNIVHYINDLK